mmetsp:Transcript_99494/g.201770  ORF Transcript_99494/g.201770 Transcript_99494/m.201770 type:complete len:381 (+) Transcript_99494:257-1399(+)
MAMLAQTTSFSIGSGGGGSSRSSDGEKKKTKNKQSVTTKIVGRSRAGDATVFAIPDLKWLFDCGAPIQQWKPKIIFLTHTHADHVHFLFRFRDEHHPPTVYLPEASVPFVEACLRAYQEMIDNCSSYENHRLEEDLGNETKTIKAHCNLLGTKLQKNDDFFLRGTKADEEIFVSQGGHRFVVRTLNMVHRIPCLGYSIFRLKNRLREKYAGLPSQEIGRLRKGGVDVTTVVEEPYLCFMGDTTAEVFEHYPYVLSQHSTVLVECSFIDDKSRNRAKITKHTHWDDLEPYVASHPETMFVLIHFSLKHSALSLRQFFREKQLFYDNIHPMLVESEIEEQWRKAGEKGPPPRCNCRVCQREQQQKQEFSLVSRLQKVQSVVT